MRTDCDRFALPLRHPYVEQAYTGDAIIPSPKGKAVSTYVSGRGVIFFIVVLFFAFFSLFRGNESPLFIPTCEASSSDLKNRRLSRNCHPPPLFAPRDYFFDVAYTKNPCASAETRSLFLTASEALIFQQASLILLSFLPTVCVSRFPRDWPNLYQFPMVSPSQPINVCNPPL